jgi:hypothetical protein
MHRQMHAYALPYISLTVAAAINVALVIHIGHTPNADSERLTAAAFQPASVPRSSAYGSGQAVGSVVAVSASTARPILALGVNAADQLHVLLGRPDQPAGGG